MKPSSGAYFYACALIAVYCNKPKMKTTELQQDGSRFTISSTVFFWTISSIVFSESFQTNRAVYVRHYYYYFFTNKYIFLIRSYRHFSLFLLYELIYCVNVNFGICFYFEGIHLTPQVNFLDVHRARTVGSSGFWMLIVTFRCFCLYFYTYIFARFTAARKSRFDELKRCLNGYNVGVT